MFLVLICLEAFETHSSGNGSNLERERERSRNSGVEFLHI